MVSICSFALPILTTGKLGILLYLAEIAKAENVYQYFSNSILIKHSSTDASFFMPLPCPRMFKNPCLNSTDQRFIYSRRLSSAVEHLKHTTVSIKACQTEKALANCHTWKWFELGQIWRGLNSKLTQSALLVTTMESPNDWLWTSLVASTVKWRAPHPSPNRIEWQAKVVADLN